MEWSVLCLLEGCWNGPCLRAVRPVSFVSFRKPSCICSLNRKYTGFVYLNPRFTSTEALQKSAVSCLAVDNFSNQIVVSYAVMCMCKDTVTFYGEVEGWCVLVSSWRIQTYSSISAPSKENVKFFSVTIITYSVLTYSRLFFLIAVFDGEFGKLGARNMNAYKSSLKKQIEEDYLPLFLCTPKERFIYGKTNMSVFHCGPYHHLMFYVPQLLCFQIVSPKGQGPCLLLFVQLWAYCQHSINKKQL